MCKQTTVVADVYKSIVVAHVSKQTIVVADVGKRRLSSWLTCVNRLPSIVVDMRVNTKYINSTRGTSSKKEC